MVPYLARLIHDATEAPAGLFRARGTPTILKDVEIKGIQQARAWKSVQYISFILMLRKLIGVRTVCAPSTSSVNGLVFRVRNCIAFVYQNQTLNDRVVGF
jgi:hypothetical protein